MGRWKRAHKSMSANSDLLKAFNDSVDRLSLGQPIEALLNQYPARIAAQLRPMLESAQLARRASTYPIQEVNAARERARVKVLGALQSAPFIASAPSARKLIQFPVRRLLTAAAAIVLVVVAILAFYPRSETPAYSESLTPATSAPTLTPTPTSSQTPNQTPSLMPSQTSAPILVTTISPLACVFSAPEGWVSYAVRAGDTLSELALNTGATLEQVQTVNCITDPRLLRVSQAIFLPRKPTTNPVSSTPTATPSGDEDGGGGSVSPTEDPGGDDDSGGEEEEDDSGGDDDSGGEEEQDDDPTPEDEDNW